MENSVRLKTHDASGLDASVSEASRLAIPQVVAMAPAGCAGVSIALAAGRAGFLGLVNGELGPLPVAAVEQLAGLAKVPFGLKLSALDAPAFELVEAYAGRGLEYLVLDAESVLAEPSVIGKLSALGVRTLIEFIVWDDRLIGVEGHAGLIVKGHEAGGRVGEETSLILLQKALARQQKPVLVRGGIGIHGAAAVMAGGAAGVVLDDQLLLLKESPLSPASRAALANLTGLETAIIGPDEIRWRVFEKPGFRHVRQLRKTLSGLDAAAMEKAVAASFGWADPMKDVFPLGQAVAFAEVFAARYATVGRLAQAIIAEATKRPPVAARLNPLGPGQGVAVSHGTKYPIVQGPMTRVSDVAGFAQAVGEAGGLPMLALALMRPEQVETLLAETAERLQGKPWGVGLLGFAPAELIHGQMEVARRHAPRFALIAGGRPDQARDLEAEGVATYLHVPSPRLLTMFLEQGAHRFVFEGRECGGHVGPLSSLVLWDTMVATLLAHVRDPEAASRIHVLFAGGIHDARSAAIVSALAAPLVELGIKIGVLMGSAYLFTREIVDSGAIVQGFQDEALTCEKTVTLETGPGHASRATLSPFAEHFFNRRREMEVEGRSPDEIREELESFTLGRLRVASKGTERAGPEGKIRKVPTARQKLEGMFMIGQVATLRDEVVTVADVHYAVSEGAHALLAAPVSPALSTTPVPPKPADIAIVGLSGIFPKAGNVRDYWENILDRVDSITEIPAHRWDWRLYFDADRTVPDKIYSRWGGFLDDVLFDPMRYGIPPNSITSVDPLQLMTLEVVRACLADAGMENLEASRERVSLILGASGGAGDVGAQYAVRSEMPRFLGELDGDAAARLPKWTEDSFAGILLNVAAGRSANRFDMGGVNFTVDAACASSLTAVYQAVMELETGRSDLVIAGGVDTVQGPFGYLCFSKTQALSPRGRCSTFDASADGIVISEGIAMVALKRLADAERDGDRVYAVLKGAGGSSDGYARSMTAPHPDGQIRAMRRAYQMAGYSPSTVGLFEAHGTGTAAGDAAELETVTRLLGEANAVPRNSAIGSVKTLIGHTKATAGVAGLIKATLAVHHGVLPPHGKLDTPNRVIADPKTPLYVLDEARPWVTEEGVPRRASVSAFGFGGTNFHLTLEAHNDAVAPNEEAPQRRWPYELLVWRGADRAALASAVRASADKLTALTEAPELRDLAFTLASTAPKTGLAVTLVVSRGDKVSERVAALADVLEGPGELLPPGAAFSAEPMLAAGAKLALVFPGQGSQYPGMLRQMGVYFPEMRASLTHADALLVSEMREAGLPGGKLSRAIFPAGAYGDAAQDAAARELTRTDIAQPALGAVEAGLYDLFSAMGVAADMTAGHSYGELVALHAAGAFDRDTLLKLSAARGRCMVAAANGGDLGTMLAVRAERSAVEQAVAGIADLVVANHNAPQQAILSGTREAIAAAHDKLDAAGIRNQSIPVGAAFHSPIVAAAKEGLSAFLETVDFATPALPVFANSTAARYPDEASEAKAILASQLVSSVEFVAEVEAMYEAGARVFLSVGPKGTHATLVRQILGDRPHRAIASDDETGGLQAFLQSLGMLLAEGATLSLDRLWAGRDCRLLDAKTLAPIARKPVPGKHMWWLNGSGAHRVGTEPAKPLTLEDVTARAIQAPAQAAAPAPTMTIEPPAPPAAASPSVPAPNGAGRRPNMGLRMMDTGERRALSDADQAPEAYDAVPASSGVMSEFQITMQRFLATQESVLLAYLGAGAGAGVARPVRPLPAIAAPAPRPAAPPRAVAAPRPAPAPVAPAPVAPAPVVAAPAPAPIQVPAAAAPAASVNGSGNGHAAAVPSPALAPAAPAPAPATAAPAAPAGLTREMLLDMLLGMVEDRTGYPRDMLGLDQKLEADLGIDSIKRVEIVGALIKTLPAGAVASTDGLGEKLNACKTLQGMIDCLEGAIGTTGAPPAAAVAGSAARPFDVAGSDTAALSASARPPRFIMEAQAEEHPASIERLPAGVYLITDDDTGVAAAVSAQIASAGGTPRWLDPAAGPEVDIASHEPVFGLIHLAPLATVVRSPEQALSHWREDIARNEALPHQLMKRFGEALSRGGRVLLVSALGGHFGRGARLGGISLQGGNPGLAKSAQEEWPAAMVKALDLDPSLSPAELATQVMGELLASGGRREVGYPAGKRTVFRTVEAEVDPAGAERLVLEPGAVVLATGGARGITAETLRPLAKPGVTLVLCGRTPLPGPEEAGFAEAKTPAEIRSALIAQARASGTLPKPAELERSLQALLRDREIRANLADLTAAGAKVDYRICDVRDVEAAKGLVAGILKDFGRLDGVLHGAGVIEDKLIVDKDPFSWSRVVETKAMSALAIATALDPAKLKFFILFGSVAGRYGNSGQSDYSAANELLNRLASQLRALWPASAKVAVLNWGPWLGTRHGPGMVSEETRRKFEAKGVGLVPPEGGALACYDEIVRAPIGDVEIVVGEGPWERHESDMATASAHMSAAVTAPSPGDVPAAPAQNGAHNAQSAPIEVALSAHPLDRLPLLAGASMGPGARGGRLLRRTLTLDRDLHLEQHRIDGVPVLPAAVALELAAEACAAVWPGWQVSEVSELRLLSGLKLDDDAPRDIELAVLGSEHGDSSGFGASVELRSPSGRPHYRVALKISDHLPKAEPLGWTLSPARAEIDVRTAYRDLLFHGPCFQALTRFDGLDDSGIVADVRASRPADFIAGVDAEAAWLFDPALVDAAAQLAWVWSCVRRNAAALPNRFGRVRRFAGVGAPHRMLFALQPDLPEHQVAADVAVVDAEGRTVFIIEELESTANAALNRLRGYAGEIRL